MICVTGPSTFLLQFGYGNATLPLKAETSNAWKFEHGVMNGVYNEVGLIESEIERKTEAFFTAYLMAYGMLNEQD
jgi:hypothetical protein